MNYVFLSPWINISGGNIPSRRFRYNSNWVCVNIKGATIIGDNAFEECKNILEVYIHDTTTTILNNAFKGCENLVKVQLPDTLRYIGNSTFQHCYKLCDIKTPNGFQHLGAYAFYNASLTEFNYASSIQYIGQYAFYWCQINNITIVPTLYN